MCTLPGFESPEAEAEFWQERDARLFGFRCWMIFAGVFAFFMFFIIDILILTDDLWPVLTVRFATSVVGLGLWALFCVKQSPVASEVIMGMLGVVTIGANLVIMTIAEPPMADLLPFAVSVILAFGVGLLAPRFRSAFCVTIFCYVFYWMVLPFSNTSFASSLANGHFLSISVFAALVGTFAREKLEREQAIDKRKYALLNERAVEMSLSKDRLLASVSHELRTPVNAIMGFSEVMQKEIFGPVEPKRYRSYIDDIHFSAVLLRTGIDDLLDVSRIVVNKVAWQDAITPLSLIVSRSVTLCKNDAQEAGVTLTLSSCDSDPTIHADPHRLTQALVNLIVNAIKFSERGGTVRIDTRLAQDGSVVIGVADDGCGIAPADLDRIREPFAQAHSDQYSTHRGGLGLGLAIASGFIDRMEGKLGIESTPGAGTTVSILIPSHRVAQVQQAEEIHTATRPETNEKVN